MKLEDLIRDYKVYIVLGAIIGFFLLFILMIIQTVRISKLNKKYNSFIRGNDGKSLEEVILTRFNEVDELKEEVATTTKKIKEINDTLLTTYQKMGIVKYDAFKEMGGKLSFALALLDDSNNGFIINSMHSSREGCYTYIKEVIQNLGELKQFIYGVHLNKTLPKHYMQQDRSYLVERYREAKTPQLKMRVLKQHIQKLDPHQPFDHEIAKQIVEYINPKFCVYETNPDDIYEMAYFIKKQNLALGYICNKVQ